MMARARIVTMAGTPSLARRLVGSPGNALITLLLAASMVVILPPLVRWAITDAALFPAVPESCRAVSGACWSFIVAKHSQILFGIYPDAQRWRPLVVCVILLGLLVFSVRPRAWQPRLAIAWFAALGLSWWLMAGGAGLVPVGSDLWGGLPVTLILTVVAIGLGFPTGVLLALARRSTLPVIRLLATLFIETTRALPLLSILFIASIMLPLLLPEEILPDKFFRALIALYLFASAYLAEVVRGGLQAIPRGQYEAGEALGLPYWQLHLKIILPQAIVVVIPALTNTVIVMIKNTSLVLVVGLFDLISSGKAALADPAWSSPSIETYLFITLIYFLLCFGFSRFADRLERRTKVPTK
ncbi:MAG: amino acid ABC transporter permease [Dechloromonas sp.]|uniref:amino acid ABC transporter permease n=1 Tax=Sphingopyxis sp. SCN 67-31 TaxID=1660142 RepID=UPI000A5E09E7|nr:amino acid ABC transporter permease [Sphingopyxis sp. SCN 67-31]KAB2920405.1 MAG: amino acid ABC transporter permease [Dechloromonas sp.]